MLSIFIPQDTLEDILIDNMPSDMEPEDQDVWFKIIINQEVIYVSSWDDTKYPLDEDPLMKLSNSFGVEIRTETPFFEAIPDNHRLVTQYKNGIFLLDIPEEEAAEIQRDYGVICQSIDNMDASVLMDPDLRFSLKKHDKNYSWSFILQEINGEQIPSNHLILVDRYLFARDKDEQKEKKDLNNILTNIYEIMNAMLPVHKLKCRYKITFIETEAKEGKSFFTSEISKLVCEKLIPELNRPYGIDVEMIHLTCTSGLYTATHNRCILTNYTITQLEHKIRAFDGESSVCMQTIMPQGLFTPSGLNGYCDSPHKTHHDVMSAINDNLAWWVRNWRKEKSTFLLNGKETKITQKYGAKKIGDKWMVFDKKT